FCSQHHYGGMVLIQIINNPRSALMHIDRTRVGLGVGLLAADRAKNGTGFPVDNLHWSRARVAQVNHPCGMLFVGPVPAGRTAPEISRGGQFFDEVTNMVRIAEVS